MAGATTATPAGPLEAGAATIAAAAGALGAGAAGVATIAAAGACPLSARRRASKAFALSDSLDATGVGVAGIAATFFASVACWRRAAAVSRSCWARSFSSAVVLPLSGLCWRTTTSLAAFFASWAWRSFWASASALAVFCAPFLSAAALLASWAWARNSAACWALLASASLRACIFWASICAGDFS